MRLASRRGDPHSYALLPFLFRSFFVRHPGLDSKTRYEQVDN